MNFTRRPQPTSTLRRIASGGERFPGTIHLRISRFQYMRCNKLGPDRSHPTSYGWMHAGLLMQVSRSQMLDSLLLALRGLPQHLVPLLRRCRHIRHQAEICHRTSEQDNRYLLVPQCHASLAHYYTPTFNNILSRDGSRTCRETAADHACPYRASAHLFSGPSQQPGTTQHQCTWNCTLVT